MWKSIAMWLTPFRVFILNLLLFSCLVMSDSLWLHGLLHTRPPVSHLLLEFAQVHVHCIIGDAIQPSSHPAISSSDTLFSCSQSFLAPGSFPMSELFASGDQSTGASASVLPVSIQGWFSLRLTGLILLLSNRPSKVFSSTTVSSHQFFGTLPSSRSSSRNCTWPLLCLR